MKNTARNNGNWKRFKFEDEAVKKADERKAMFYEDRNEGVADLGVCNEHMGRMAAVAEINKGKS